MNLGSWKQRNGRSRIVAGALVVLAAGLVSVFGSVAGRHGEADREDALEILAARGITVVPDDNGCIASLVLRNRSIDDHDLQPLGRLRDVTYVDLSGTQVGDAGLKHLCGLRNLEKLYLCGTQVTDAGLMHVSQCRNLTVLDLSGTSISDDGLQTVGNLQNLEFLLIEETDISEGGAARLRTALPDCRIKR